MMQLPGAFKKIQGLGSPLAIYPLRNAFLVRVGGILLVLVFILGGLSAAGWAGLDAYERYYHHGPAVVWRGLGLPLVLAILLIALGFLIGRAVVRRWNKALLVFEQGIAVRDLHGLVICRWSDVASLRIDFSRRVFAGIPLSTSRNVSLVKGDGERASFDSDIRNADEALDRIRARLLPVLYERFEPEFEQGKAFVFGPIELQKDEGVRLKQKTMSWSSLQKAAIDRGKLQLAASESNGKVKEICVPVSEIPNLDLLMAFIRQIKPAI